MAAEVTRQSPPRPKPASRRWAAAATATILFLGAIGAVALHTRQKRHRIRAAMPPLPVTVSIPALREALTHAEAKARSGQLEAVAELGRILHANEFLAEAESCWRLLVREQPGEGRWHYYLADILRTTGDQAAAEEQLEQTVKVDPRAASAWLQLGEIKLKTGRWTEAAHDYRQRLRLVPDDPYAALGLARIDHLQGRRDNARVALEQILQRQPAFSAARNLYAELLAAFGREEEAERNRWLGREAGRFREADDPWLEEINVRCLEPRRLCHLGVIAYQTATGDRGRARFEQAIALMPTDPLPYQMLGALQLEGGDAAAARETLLRGLARATTLAPDAQHYLKLQEACLALHRDDEARRALADGLKRHPDAAELWYANGNQLKRDGKTPEAVAAFQRVTELNPAFVEADFALAVLWFEQGKRADAVALLQRALHKQPSFPKAQLVLARMEIDAGRFESAGSYLLPLLRANPGAPEVRQIVGQWRLQWGRQWEQSRPDLAEQHYREGVKLMPNDPDLNAALGILLLLKGDVEQAVGPLEIYQRTSPTNPQAALFLGQAYARVGRLPEARTVLTSGLRQAEQANQRTTANHLREILTQLP